VLRRCAGALDVHDLNDFTSLGIQRYLTRLGETLKPISVHHCFRPLKTFFWWCVEVGLLAQNPVQGITNTRSADIAARARGRRRPPPAARVFHNV